MRSFNEGWALRETLPALRAQDYQNWELIVIDSGSTDGSVDLIRQANPRHFVQIKPEEYNPSRVMNHGMALSRSEFSVFLNADATPQGTNWLRPLVRALHDPQTAAVFGRQIPRPDCRAVFAHDYERCFGPDRESAGWEHFFSMVSSGLRKDIWAKRGFVEQMQYSEDDEYTRWCRSQGYRVAYCPESVAMHSHNYTPAQAYKRSFGEAKALAAVWTGQPEEINLPRTVLLGWLNDVRRDCAFCAWTGRLAELPHASRIRWRQRRAKLAGFRAGWEVYRLSGMAQTNPERVVSPCAQLPALTSRFTIDGSDALEEQLAGLCREISTHVQKLIPASRLDALVLGGGYGRGEGGVLKTESGARPYNDLEFYVFLNGNPLLNERKYGVELRELGDRLSPAAGLHVEFKIDSLEKLRTAQVSMFTYDLAAKHRIILGDDNTFQGCEHHLQSENIPLSEATRLLFNRCTGLLLAKELMAGQKLTLEQSDFIGRNLAKAQLALGDAVLTVFGQYHYSAAERNQRLSRLALADPPPSLALIRQHHGLGVAFKLRPKQSSESLDYFEKQHREISALASALWLWTESRRLDCSFANVRDYAFNSREKCLGPSGWRNYLLNLKTFGPGVAFDGKAARYPRERLFNSLPLLLWNGELSKEPDVKLHLQRQLRTEASDWQGLVAAYKQIWPAYG